MRRPGLAPAATTATLVLASTVPACAGDDAPSALDPAGSGAQRIEGLWWLLFWVALAIFVVVLGFLAVAVIRGLRGTEPDERVGWGEPFIVIAGVILPSLILGAIFVISLTDINALSERGRQADLTIEVVAHDWWWEVRYPNGAITANEIHIPVGEPVRLQLESADVIHSFWVPRLQAKMDMTPGRVTTMWLEADEAGRYRGQCAEFCGLQHAKMLFEVVAEPAAEFEEWVANEGEPAAEPVDENTGRGEEVFMTTTCIGCHTIRGTEATADLGPDLTHLAARATIGAGILPNEREALAFFITETQRAKEGAAMPPTELDDDELEALLDYLESLE